MKLRWIQTENTPYRYVAEGTEAEVTDERARELIDAGIAVPVPVKAERAVKPKAQTAVKK